MAVTLYASDTEMRSNMVRSLHDWWRSRCRAEIPDRSDLDPAHLKLLLPNLFISDIEPKPFRVRYRLVGTKAVEATGMDITGRYLDELLPADGSEPWMALYHRAYLTREPVFGAANAPTKAGGYFTYEFGLFPLRNGGDWVAQFVALEDYFDLRLTLTELVEWQKRNAEGLSERGPQSVEFVPLTLEK